uniref:Putative secreted peptide n=1 Tax=Anopheles braziliensis TaxID=58242 RepID=A0A2M3ZR46_9DIPT
MTIVVVVVAIIIVIIMVVAIVAQWFNWSFKWFNYLSSFFSTRRRQSPPRSPALRYGPGGNARTLQSQTGDLAFKCAKVWTRVPPGARVPAFDLGRLGLCILWSDGPVP